MEDTRYTGILVILAIIVISGAVIIADSAKDQIAARELNREIFGEIPRDEISRILLSFNQSRNQVILSRDKSGEWKTGHAGYPVSSSTISEILNVLSTTRSTRLVARKSSSFPRYGVDEKSGIRVTYLSENPAKPGFAVVIGRDSTDEVGTFVRPSEPSLIKSMTRESNGDNSLSPTYRLDLPIRHLFDIGNEAKDWRSRQVVSFAPSNVTKVELVNRDGDFVLKLGEDGEWTGATNEANPDPSLVISFLNNVISIRTVRFEDPSGEEETFELPTDAALDIKVTETVGDKNIVHELKIARSAEADSDEYFVQVDNRDYLFVISAFDVDQTLERSFQRILDNPLPEKADKAPIAAADEAEAVNDAETSNTSASEDKDEEWEDDDEEMVEEE